MRSLRPGPIFDRLGNVIGVWRVPGRDVRVCEDDVFVVSYPKSGNTWVRFIVAMLRAPSMSVDFGNIEALVPDIYQNTRRVLSSCPRPRILKSHEYLDPRYRRVIYVVRDPRDVAVSYFHFLRKMRSLDDSVSLEEFVPQFVAGEADPFGSWADHVGGWLGARACVDDFLLLRYEEMRADPREAVKRVAEFIGLDPTEAQLQQVLAQSSMDAMRRLEQNSGMAWKATRGGIADIPFVGTGEDRCRRSPLPGEARVLIERRWGEVMTQVGYSCHEVQAGAHGAGFE